jgi:uncharacterized protein
MATDVKAVFRQMGAAIEKKDAASLAETLRANPGILQQGKVILLLKYAAGKDDPALVSLLVEHGADVNTPESDSMPEGAIYTAAMNGAARTVEWLLSHRARINQVVDGVTRCLPLAVAIRQGHLEVVKLLVEHGADVNAVWAGQNALSTALTYKQEAIANYLREKGAREPAQLGETPPKTDEPTAIVRHIEEHLGKPEPLVLREIVPGEPSIALHVVRLRHKLALVTEGMSSRPMKVPRGGEAYRFAELVMYLPAKWPLTEEALRDPNHFWPVEWLRKIARYPHDHKTWLGGKVAVIANGEPPEPLAPATKMTCLLVVAGGGDFGRLALPDGRQIVFYEVFPLYTEERDLEKDKGTEALLQLFEKNRIKPIVDMDRKNVALTRH